MIVGTFQDSIGVDMRRLCQKCFDLEVHPTLTFSNACREMMTERNSATFEKDAHRKLCKAQEIFLDSFRSRTPRLFA
jgi:hypothetical protein